MTRFSDSVPDIIICTFSDKIKNMTWDTYKLFTYEFQIVILFSSKDKGHVLHTNQSQNKSDGNFPKSLSYLFLFNLIFSYFH